MSQNILNLDKETDAVIKQIDQSANLEPSQWLSQFVKHQIKQHQAWSLEVKALSGRWDDFPSLEDIRSNHGTDSIRESL